jgi:putative glutamine amidotransferase
MTTARPRIAIPEPTSTDDAYNKRSLPQYVHAVEAAGGTAVIIPLLASFEEQASLVGTSTGILLPGSPADVEPERYGQERAKETAEMDGPREATDDLLLRDALSQGKPVFGICYGLQSINVWQGGTLIQDVPSQKGGRGLLVNHAPGREVEKAHLVKVASGSRLASILGGGNDALAGDGRSAPTEDGDFVNSSHHQAVGQPGDSLHVVATSPADGIVEALEASDPQRFLLGVQWHPERSYESSRASRALFAAFIDAARAWKPDAS